MSDSTDGLTYIAAALPPLRVDGGHYPVDVDATVSTGYVTYQSFVASEGREMRDDILQSNDPDVPLDSTVNPEDYHLDAEFGTLDDLNKVRPVMSALFIPEVNKRFWIRTLTGQEVDTYRSSITVGKGANTSVNQRGMRAKLVVLSLGNPDGSRMLTDKDVQMVQGWPSAILEQIFDRSRKFNKLTEEDTDEEKGNS